MSAYYEPIELTINDLDRITLPDFQRGFVWSKKKKNEFIETLSKGFPFGTLLVYPESEETGSRLLLLDGQQRLSTIKEYLSDPLVFWKPNNSDRYQQSLKDINQLLEDQTGEPKILNEKEFDDLVNGGTDAVANWLDQLDDEKGVNASTRTQVRTIFKDLHANIDSYVNVTDIRILAIKFTGSKEHIAEVFSNLNKGGMPLSKYEIHRAAWIHEKVVLSPAGSSKQQDKILGLVKDYYTEMSNNAEFDLNGFSEDELTAERSITLSELGAALGMFAQSNLGALISDTPNSINEIGFGILGIATNTDNRQLDILSSKANQIRDNLQVILEKTERICVNLQSTFSKLLRRISATKSDCFESGLSASFKTLSYFAALWDLDPDSEEYRRSLNNIRSFYVFDSWTKAWSSHGDQRLSDYYPKQGKRTYLEPVSQESFEDALNQWLSDTTPGINFNRETKALVTIHANLSYLSTTVPHGESFELEHIIAKKRINEVDSDPSNRKIYGGALGNCMYLPKQLNNKKKEKTLYDINCDGNYDELIRDAFYFDKEQLDSALSALASKNVEEVNKLIFIRGSQVGKDLINKLLKA